MRRRAALAALALLLATGPAAAKEGAPAAPQNTVRLRQVMVPALANGRVERYVPYEITLEIAAAARMPEILGMTPRLQDTATAVVYEAVDKGWIARGIVTDANALRQRLEDACNAVLGKGTVGRVLLAPATRPAQ